MVDEVYAIMCQLAIDLPWLALPQSITVQGIHRTQLSEMLTIALVRTFSK